MVDNQDVIKKLQKRAKKNPKKMLLVLKKYLPLQCFNKQRLFYSFKKAKKKSKENEEISFYVRSNGCNLFRFMW